MSGTDYGVRPEITGSDDEVIIAELVETGTLPNMAIPAGWGAPTASPQALFPPPADTSVFAAPSAAPVFPATHAEPLARVLRREDVLTALVPAAGPGRKGATTRLRAGIGDWLALVLAIVLPPIGLVLSIVVRAISRHRTGWSSAVARTATVLGTVFTIIAAMIGLVFGSVLADAAGEAQLRADSAPFCSSLAETPGVLETPGYGWSNDPLPIAESLEAMTAYQQRWSSLADVAPAPVRADVAAVAAGAQTLITEVETTRSIDRQGNLDRISTLTAGSAIPAFVGVYCG